MAKRFTDTAKWGKAWFHELSLDARWAWIYLLDNCDNTGVWHSNFALMSFQVGFTVSEGSLKSWLGSKIIKFDSDKFFIPSFIKFQYSELQERNNAHKPVLKFLQKYPHLKVLLEGPSVDLEGLHRSLQDKDQDQAKVQIKNMVNDQEEDKKNLSEVAPQESLKIVKRLTPDEIVDLWNQTLARNGFNSTPSLGSGKHNNNCLEAIKWLPDIKSWQDLFQKVESSKFLKGGNDRNWIMPLTWLVDYDNALRVLSDEFDDTKAIKNLFAGMKATEDIA